MVESPPNDKEGQLAWVARRTVDELAAAGAPLDVDAICAGIAATYEYYHLGDDLLGRLRVYVTRWVDRTSQPGWRPRESSASKPPAPPSTTRRK